MSKFENIQPQIKTNKIIDIIKNPIVIIIGLIVISGIILTVISLYSKKYDLCDETANDYIDNKCLPKCPVGQIRCNDICYEPDKKKCIDNQYTCMLCNPGDTECCKNETCSDDPLNRGKKICCSELQKCSITDVNGIQKTICCDGGSICQNNKCVVVCGKKTDGTDNICDDKTQVCSIISNVDPQKNSSLYDSLTKSENNFGSENPDKTWDFYNCKDKNPTAPTDNRPFSAPSSLNNQYPCFNIPKTDNEPGLGFCSSKNINTNTSIDDVDIIKCKKYNDKKTCEPDVLCKWNDVLKYNKNDIQDLNLAISKTFDNGSGLYCGSQGQRTIGYTYANKDSIESMNSCFNTFINDTTSDIEYVPSTGSCVSLLKCGDSDKSTINLYNLTTNENSIVKNKVENPIPTKFSTSTNDFYMPSCDNKSEIEKLCNSNTDNSFTYNNNLHCLEDGTLKYSIANCVSDNTAGIGSKGECICKPNYIGQTCAYSDRTTCGGRGKVDYNGNCVCNDGAKGPNCALMTTEEYFQSGWDSGVLYNWLNEVKNKIWGYGTGGIGWGDVVVLKVLDTDYLVRPWGTDPPPSSILDPNNTVSNGKGGVDHRSSVPLFFGEYDMQVYTKNTNKDNTASFQLTCKGSSSYDACFGVIIRYNGTDTTLEFASNTPPPLPYKYYGAGSLFSGSSPIFIMFGSKYIDGSN